MIKFELKHPRVTRETLGFIPSFLSKADARSAREQFNDNYRHGGGWQRFEGFQLTDEGLKYPGDPPMPLLAEARLRDEVVKVFDCAWVVVVQKDGSWEASRMD